MKDYTMLTRTCNLCGVEIRNDFNLYPAIFLVKKYCSKKCEGKAKSIAKLGDRNPAKSQRVRQRISETLKKKYASGELKVYVMSEAERKANSERMLGEKNPNYQGRSNEKIQKTCSEFSFEKKQDIRKRIGDANRGFSKTTKKTHPEWYEHIKIAAVKPERRKKIRLARLQQIEEQCRKNGQTFAPSFNHKAILFFKKLDSSLGSAGQYALSLAEYKTVSGYFLDYINFERKLIIEWDEKGHYKKDGSLRKRDVLRQQEIEAEFPDFQFIRVREIEESEFSSKIRELFLCEEVWQV